MNDHLASKATARLAGFIYFIVVMTGIFSLAYVPKLLYVWERADLTFENIACNEMIYRLGILSSIICYVAFIFLPLVLYMLLSPVHRVAGKLMVILALISVPIAFSNLQHKLSVLSLIDNDKLLIFQNTNELHKRVMFHLLQYNQGVLTTSVFWGLWLLPFGYLVLKSGFIPKIFGILLMLGCFGYLTNITGNILIKNYSDLGIAQYISMPASIGEIGICFWLLIIGIRRSDTNNRSSNPYQKVT